MASTKAKTAMFLATLFHAEPLLQYLLRQPSGVNMLETLAILCYISIN